jgi:hypothetical protein
LKKKQNIREFSEFWGLLTAGLMKRGGLQGCLSPAQLNSSERAKQQHANSKSKGAV